MGKKQPIPWAFQFSDGPKRGPGRWGRALFGRAWDVLRRGLKVLLTPAGASLLVFLTTLVTGYMLYPVMFGPFDRPAPREERMAAEAIPAPARDSVQQPAPPTPEGPPAVALRALDPARVGRPVEGRIVGGPGWQKDPTYGDWRYHGGLDLEAQVDSEIRAVWAGKVAEVRMVPGGCLGRDRAYEVALRHSDGWETRYRYGGAPVVGVGDQLLMGAPVFRSVSPGRIHFDLLKDGEHISPTWASSTAKPY